MSLSPTTLYITNLHVSKLIKFTGRPFVWTEIWDLVFVKHRKSAPIYRSV